MILVTTGTNGVAFDRLLAPVVTLECNERLVVQHGPSSLRRPDAEYVDYLPFPQLADLVAEARLVITHGGVGSILLAQIKGKRPLVVPRLRRYREAIDDHQFELAVRLDAIGVATLVADPGAELQPLIDSDTPRLVLIGERTSATGLVHDLKEYVAATTRMSRT